MSGMRIYLLRHGIAEDPRPGLADPDRTLTAEGLKRLQAIRRRSALPPMLTLSSPYRRALQTAGVFEGEIVACRELTPMSDPSDAWNEIRLHKDADQLLVSSHEPLCGRLAAFLLNSPALAIDFKKGALVCIDVASLGPRPSGTLKWMLIPKLA